MTARMVSALATLSLLTLPAAAQGQVKTGYAPVNGLQLYYEIHGTPNAAVPPLVLLHGGGDTLRTSFGHVLPDLARNRQVIAFEQQGYGHTADVADRPFSFEQSADDTAALLDFLHVKQADLLGFSNGGTIALQVAIRHPQVVRRLVVISAFFRRDGGEPSFWEGMKHATLDNMPKELRDAYLEVAPHPENLPSFFEKSANRMRNFKDIPDDAIRGIHAPVLVIAGDRDVVRPEHAVATYRLLQHAQLAVIPNTDHMTLMSRTALVVPMVEAFLD
ncbi:MAG TPA: alpha/beta hydrolase [Thermoanaerobaculia bacterium]|nr:alpha/beta hydrolase [Thermoanaerobaculia bacterium]